MGMRYSPPLLCFVALIVLSVLVGGCGGATSPVAQATDDTSSRTATVVVRVVGAQEELPPAGTAVCFTSETDSTERCVTVDDSGFATFEGVPPGPAMFVLTLPGGGPHDALPLEVKFPVDIPIDRPKVSLFVRLAAPASAATSLTLTPSIATVEVGQMLQFTATVTPDTGVKPNYMVQGTIGTISPDGVFTAVTPGVGQVIAVIGGVSAMATVEVVAP